MPFVRPVSRCRKTKSASRTAESSATINSRAGSWITRSTSVMERRSSPAIVTPQPPAGPSCAGSATGREAPLSSAATSRPRRTPATSQARRPAPGMSPPVPPPSATKPTTASRISPVRKLRARKTMAKTAPCSAPSASLQAWSRGEQPDERHADAGADHGCHHLADGASAGVGDIAGAREGQPLLDGAQAKLRPRAIPPRMTSGSPRAENDASQAAGGRQTFDGEQRRRGPGTGCRLPISARPSSNQ